MKLGFWGSWLLPVKILYVSKGKHAASTRYRALRYVPLLEREGYEVSHLTDDRRVASRVAILRAARAADIVVHVRRPTRGVYLWLLRLASKILVFDFDDAIDRSSSRESRGRRARFQKMVASVDEVWAGNTFLAEKARAFCDNVVVMPTAVEKSRYDVSVERPSETIDLVWIGSSSTAKYLEAHLPVLERVARAVPGLRLKIVADFTLQSNELEVVECPWSDEGEAVDVGSAHIGVAPLTDDPWTRGKCGLKVLQYMAASLPVVASDVGVHGDLIEDGESGILAVTSDDWVEALTMLCNDPSLRRSMGEKGRKRVEVMFDREIIAKQMVERIEGLLRRMQ